MFVKLLLNINISWSKAKGYSYGRLYTVHTIYTLRLNQIRRIIFVPHFQSVTIDTGHLLSGTLPSSTLICYFIFSYYVFFLCTAATECIHNNKTEPTVIVYITLLHNNAIEAGAALQNDRSNVSALQHRNSSRV